MQRTKRRCHTRLGFELLCFEISFHSTAHPHTWNTASSREQKMYMVNCIHTSHKFQFARHTAQACYPYNCKCMSRVQIRVVCTRYVNLAGPNARQAELTPRSARPGSGRVEKFIIGQQSGPNRRSYKDPGGGELLLNMIFDYMQCNIVKVDAQLAALRPTMNRP